MYQVEEDLYVSLEEIYSGCCKRLKVSYMVPLKDGTTKIHHKFLYVNIKPGWKEGTKIIFKKTADTGPYRIPKDIVFTLRDKPHPIFKRKGKDIKYTAKVTLKEALCGAIVDIPTLNNRTLTLPMVNEIITPQITKRIVRAGLPSSKDPEIRGDIIVSFDIIFPQDLKQTVKNLLNDLLPR